MRFHPYVHQQQETTMGLLSMKMNLALLWGISVLFAMESMSAFIPKTDSTAEPDKTTTKLISAHVLHTETQKPAEISVAAPAEITVSPTVETKEAIITDRIDSSDDSTSGLVAMNTVTTTTSSSGPPLLYISTAVTTTAGALHPSNNTTISETAKPTEEQSPSTSTDTTAPATASTASTLNVPSSQPTSTTKPEVTSTTSPANSSPYPVFTQTLSSPLPSTTAITIANPTSEAAPVFDPTTGEASSTEFLSTSQPISVTTIPISTTGSSSTAEPPNISFSTDSPIPTTNVSPINVSTSPAGILITHMPKIMPIPITKSTLATTTAPREVSKSPLSTEAQPCSTRGVVKTCLIAVASLATLATAFIVSTIILCTKLSTRKYKVKKTSQPATEMMCISALLPEKNYTYSRQRSPPSNGVLVIHGGADSDEDGGDNLTLSSFLPENDRIV